MSCDVLLINAITGRAKPAYIPNGLLYVAAVLRENGITVKVYDRNTETLDTKSILDKYDPRIVGISVLTGEVILDAINVSKLIRKDRNIPIVWGGLHPTLFPKYVLSERYVDYIVMGEGEYPMVELAECILRNKSKLEDIKNVGYKSNEEIRLNPLRDFIDMEKLPMPAFDLINMANYFLYRPYSKRNVNINTSRGCPYNCAFCYNETVNKRKWRGISARKIVDQIRYLQLKHNIGGVFFHEDNFDANPSRLKEFCDLMINEKINVKWSHLSRVNYAEKKRLVLAKNAGCESIAYGLESGSERILKLINKRQTVTEIENAINLCREAGIQTAVGSIIGYPYENAEDLKMTLDLFEKVKPDIIFTTIFNPYPGSDLYDYVVKNALFNEPKTLEEQGKLYSVSNVELNMSEIPNEYLEEIIHKYAFRNYMNEAKAYIKYRNFLGLFLVSSSQLVKLGVIKVLINRFFEVLRKPC